MKDGGGGAQRLRVPAILRGRLVVIAAVVSLVAYDPVIMSSGLYLPLAFVGVCIFVIAGWELFGIEPRRLGVVGGGLVMAWGGAFATRLVEFGEGAEVLRPLIGALIVLCVFLKIQPDAIRRFFSATAYAVCGLTLFTLPLFFFDDYLWYSRVFDRVSGGVFDPNYLGVLAGFSVLIVIFDPNFKFRRTCILILAASLFGSHSRAAIGGLAICFIVAIFTLPELKSKRFYWMVVLLSFFLCTCALVWFFPQEFFSNNFIRGHQLSSFSGRLEMWPSAIRVIVSEPLGIGMAGLGSLYGANGPVSTHNTYLDFGVAYGFLPLAFLFVGVFSALVRTVGDGMWIWFFVLLYMFLVSCFVTISPGGVGLVSFIFLSVLRLAAFDLPPDRKISPTLSI